MSLKNLEELAVSAFCPAFLYRLSWIVLYIDYSTYMWLLNKLL